jgi:hypothetical protein
LARVDLGGGVNVRLPDKEWRGIWIDGRLPGKPGPRPIIGL